MAAAAARPILALLNLAAAYNVQTTVNSKVPTGVSQQVGNVRILDKSENKCLQESLVGWSVAHGGDGSLYIGQPRNAGSATRGKVHKCSLTGSAPSCSQHGKTGEFGGVVAVSGGHQEYQWLSFDEG